MSKGIYEKENFSGSYQLENFCNDYTLNIFTDGSFYVDRGSYAMLAVNKYTILDSFCRVGEIGDTINSCELKGIIKALSIAHRYMTLYPCINIFSDSLYSINGIRTNFIAKQKLVMKRSTPNIELFVHIHYLLDEIDSYPGCTVTILHQNAHVEEKNDRSIYKVVNNFKNINKVTAQVSQEFIKYISMYNRMVDEMAKSYLKLNKDNEETKMPLRFIDRDNLTN